MQTMIKKLFKFVTLLTFDEEILNEKFLDEEKKIFKDEPSNSNFIKNKILLILVIFTITGFFFYFNSNSPNLNINKVYLDNQEKINSLLIELSKVVDWDVYLNISNFVKDWAYTDDLHKIAIINTNLKIYLKKLTTNFDHIQVHNLIKVQNILEEISKYITGNDK